MRSRGYTLLEILVVIVILGVLSGFAMLSLREQSQLQRLEEEASRVAALLRRQCEESLFSGRALRLLVDESGYRFESASPEGWQPPGDPVFRDRAWEIPVRQRLRLDGRTADTEQAITCLPTGEITPFELELRAPDQSAAIVQGTAGGLISHTGSQP